MKIFQLIHLILVRRKIVKRVQCLWSRPDNSTNKLKVRRKLVLDQEKKWNEIKFKSI